MKKVAVILANGCEELEAITVIDVLRRAKFEVVGVGLDTKLVKSQGGVILSSDLVFDEVDFDTFDMIVLPGGLDGSQNCAKSERLKNVLKEFDTKNKPIAAICAAPFALAKAKVLKNSYTCYPGFETQIAHLGYTNTKNVVIDQNIITSKGPATAMEFALELVKFLVGNERYLEVKNGLLF